jgi:hypothetical protein
MMSACMHACRPAHDRLIQHLCGPALQAHTEIRCCLLLAVPASVCCCTAAHCTGSPAARLGRTAGSWRRRRRADAALGRRPSLGAGSPLDELGLAPGGWMGSLTALLLRALSDTALTVNNVVVKLLTPAAAATLTC